MSNARRLFTVIVQAALLFTAACFLVAAASFLLLVPRSVWLGPPPNTLSIGEAIALSAFFVAPAALGFWWIFQRLRTDYTPPLARTAATAFAVFSPVPLIVGLVLGPIVGDYTGFLLGTQSRWVAFASAVIGIIVVIALTTFAVSLSAVWVARRMGASQTE
ncbi:MAG: hypothetical protein ACRD13_07310 [Terriglobales bacterium]